MTKEEFKRALQRTYDLLRNRKINYRLTFMCPPGQRVLEDLVSYCNVLRTCYRDTDRETARQEGRRDVWLRIQHHLKLTDAQLFKVYNGGTVNVVETEEDEDAS